MKLILILLLALVVITGAGLAYIKFRLSLITDKKDLANAIETEVGKYTKRTPHAALVVGVYKDGKTWIQGFGSKDTPPENLPTESSVFQIGSIGKLFTTSLLQILVDENVLELDATLEEVAGQQFVLSPQARTITLRQLATHTSGLPRVPKALMDKLQKSAGKKNIMVDPYSHIDLSDVAQYLETTNGIKKPGKFAYSNFGMGLLGHVLESVTGSDLESLAKERLFSKLGMASTGISVPESIQDKFIQGFTAKGKKAGLWTFGALGGAGAFYASMDDMMKFLKTNIEDDSSLSASLQKMQRADGIGWLRPGYFEKFFDNGDFLFHDGQVGGYSSYIAVDKKARQGVAVFSNSGSDITMLGTMLVVQLRKQSWAI